MKCLTFTEKGDFVAYYCACGWLKKNGISYGSMQRGDPIGLKRGDFVIQKWRNLSESDKNNLDGIMTGDKRNGPVVITLYEVTK